MATTSTTGQWSDGSLGSNIRAASSFLERRTGRQFEALTGATKTFTTDGRTFMVIPDLRTATSITQGGTTLTADSTYYLLPDKHDPAIFTGIQFRSFQSQSIPNRHYLSNPEWFDRNLDNPRMAWGSGVPDTSVPNDLVITGDWGWDPLPDDLLQATKVLAAFFAKRSDSVLADTVITPEGNAVIYSGLPLEIREFIMDWALGERAVSVG